MRKNGIIQTGIEYLRRTKKAVEKVFLPAFILTIMAMSTRVIFSATSASVSPSQPAPEVSPVSVTPTPTPAASPVCVTAHLDSQAVSSTDIDMQLALLRDAGVAWTRFDFEWNKIEKSPGTYDFSTFDFIVQKANDMGISIIAILPQWGAPGEEHMDRIKTPELYAAYAANVATQYKGNETVAFQVGNEPDVNVFWNEKPDSTEYILYLKAAAAAIKEVNPDARVITAGTLSENTVEWTRRMYQQNALVHVDDIGLHLYSQPDPPRFKVLDELVALMDEYRDQKGIAITEFGWPTMKQSDHIEGVSHDEQAAYIAEVFRHIRVTYPVVRTICVYSLRDTGQDQKNFNHHMGLVEWDYTKKPSYDEVRNASRKYPSKTH